MIPSMQQYVFENKLKKLYYIATLESFQIILEV